MIEERLHVFHAPFARRVAGEGQRAEIVAIVVGARVPPRPDVQRHHVVVLVLRLERAIDRGRAVAVFLVPLAHFEQRRHCQRLRREPFVHGLQRPELRVGRVLEELADAGDVFDAHHLREVRDRPGFEIARVVVATAERELTAAIALLGRQADDVVERIHAKGAVVEPVVAHPAIDHRALRHRRLERRMRVDLRHQRREAQVAGTDDADLAVRFRRVLHQPLDGVVGVGRFVDAGVVRPARPAAG